MSKGLEALKDMMFIPDFALHSEPEKIKCVGECQRAKNDFAIIEEELKEGEKSKRALEIIKRITFYDIRFFDYLLSENKITQEEYNLLKEVLK